MGKTIFYQDTIWLLPSYLNVCSKLFKRKINNVHKKVGLSPSQQTFLFSSMIDLQKWWKMLFISSLKLLPFSRYLDFCLDFLARRKNGLNRKMTLISKFMMSQPGLQKITTHILLNILRIKGNQPMKFGQLIEHRKRNILL